MGKFMVGDRVRILSDEHKQAGLTGVVSEVEGNDFVVYILRYKVRGFWYKSTDLTLIADADSINYARHELELAGLLPQSAPGAAEVLEQRLADLQAENARLRAALEPFIKSPEVTDLRQQFTALTGIRVPMGGNTLGTEEGRMLRLLMRDLGYKRETDCVAHGWNTRYGKDGVWGEWLPIYFGNSLAGEYQVAIAGINAAASKPADGVEGDGE